MTRAFILASVGVGAVVGWFVSIAVQVVASPSVSHGFGVVTTCLFVGTVVNSLRSH